MKVDILASGSQGNCIALTANNKTILVDAGIAKTKIEKALLAVDIRPDDVQAIFITHAHKDHTKGLPLANKYKIPVYAGEEEWKDISNVEDEYMFSFPVGVGMKMPYFDIKTFETHHDSYAPAGYCVYSDDEKVSVCLDTGRVDDYMLHNMKDSDIYIIEANHEPKMVERSDYPNSVKARVLSDVGHLSNEQTAAALCQLIQGKGEQIYLTHLSSNNNIPALAEITVVKALKDKGFFPDKHFKIEVI